MPPRVQTSCGMPATSLSPILIGQRKPRLRAKFVPRSSDDPRTPFDCAATSPFAHLRELPDRVAEDPRKRALGRRKDSEPAKVLMLAQSGAAEQEASDPSRSCRLESTVHYLHLPAMPSSVRPKGLPHSRLRLGRFGIFVYLTSATGSCPLRLISKRRSPTPR
jgi:hypothetical protein